MWSKLNYQFWRISFKRTKQSESRRFSALARKLLSRLKLRKAQLSENFNLTQQLAWLHQACCNDFYHLKSPASAGPPGKNSKYQHRHIKLSHPNRTWSCKKSIDALREKNRKDRLSANGSEALKKNILIRFKTKILLSRQNVRNITQISTT